MVSKYTILFAILAIFAVQHTTALRIDSTDERALTDLVQKAKEAIANLRELIHNTVEKAGHLLGDKVTIIKREAENLIAKTEQAINNEIEKVKGSIQKIKEQATIVGVDIEECVAEHHTELQALPRSIIDKLIQCVTDEINKAVSIITDAVNEIMDIKDDLIGLPSELKSCIGSTSPVKCVTELITKVVQDITGLPTMIQQKINAIMSLVNNIEADLKACALSKVAEATKEAGLIGIKVAKCVADKIREE